MNMIQRNNMGNIGKSGYENDDITHFWGPESKHKDGPKQKETDSERCDRFFKYRKK